MLHVSVTSSFLFRLCGVPLYGCIAVCFSIDLLTMFGLFLVWGIIVKASVNTGGQVFLCPFLLGVHLGV